MYSVFTLYCIVNPIYDGELFHKNLKSVLVKEKMMYVLAYCDHVRG